MFITNLLVVGSLAYVGAKLVPFEMPSWWQRRKPSFVAQVADSSLLVTQGSSPTQNGVVDATASGVDVATALLADQRSRAMAGTAFWLAVGGYVFPPLTLASVPFTVLSTVPILEAGSRSLFVDGRLRPAVFSSVLIVTSLVTERYVPAATLSWLHHAFYHIGRQIQGVIEQATADITEDLGDLATQVMGNPPRTVWAVRENIEVQTPYAQLEIGDVIVVSRGEFIPVDGVVMAGSGTVNMMLRTGVNAPMKVSEGERVYAQSFVSEGRFRVQIELLMQP